MSTVKSFPHRQEQDDDWRDGRDLSMSIDTDTGKTQPDRRATVSSHIESDYDGDAKQSVLSRLSHTDEEGDRW
jgi:hypothetical protein